jgi:hypothetical protein
MQFFGKTLIGIAIAALTLGFAATAVKAESQDLVYIDSLIAGPGQDVTVRFSVKNLDSIASLSIPITYDTSVLKIKSLSFVGSRIAGFSNKLTTPSTITNANGHFVVAAFRLTEKALPPGDGPVFTAVFTVASTATDGRNAKIDSLFYPPGGELLLVQAVTANSIHPSFRAGNVLVSSRPPVFSALSDQTVLEGDTLRVTVSASDPAGRSVSLSLISKPTGATLVDNGNGTGVVTWVPDFVGPNSADMSPFKLGVRATNGTASTDIQTRIVVINRDRAPVISTISNVAVQAGQPVSFSVSATDPDFDPISWSHTALPSGATFTSGNPATFTWPTALTDSGLREIKFTAADPVGFADTASVTINVAKTIIYGLKLDEKSGDPNTTVDYYVYLDNKLPVTSFRLLFNYDPSVLTLLSVTKVGTRAAAFPVYDISYNVGDIAGNTRIVGNVNSAGSSTNPPLGAGDGPIAKLSFRTSGNIIYAGQYIPIRFQFMDSPVNNDNTLTDSVGVKIEQTGITYSDGSIRINSIGTVKIGDINLNGLAYEISDVIYFSNFFINPSKYPFSAIQYANSDINGDHIVATVADLVALVNIVVGGQTPKITGEDPGTVEISVAGSSGGALVSSDCSEAIGGMLITLDVNESFDMSQLEFRSSELTAITARSENTVRILLFDINGGSLPAGANEIMQIPTGAAISEVMVSSSAGQLLTSTISATSLPAEFSLAQNYPNPFNPETQIEFALPSAQRIRLTIYNLLGQEVTVAAEGEYPAGTHTVTWRGTDAGGSPVASGMYFYRLDTPGGSLSRKMLLLK